MTLRIVCDRLMCGRYEDTRFGDPPNSWVTVGRDRQHRDSLLRSVYCSTRCAVLALGGSWPSGHPAPEPSHGNHYRTIPWPPSDELRNSLAVQLSHDLPHVVMNDCYDAVCNLLDAIGAGDE